MNKVIVITGGTTGIGEATCHLLAKEGAMIALTDINDSAGKNTVQKIKQEGGRAEFWHMDTRFENEVKQVIQEVANQFGRIDVLVNNAAIIGSNNPTHEFLEEDWDKVMAVSVKGVLFCTKHVVPYLKKAGGGSIINVSSLHGLLGTPDYPANHAAKGAVRLMSKTDAMLYVKDRIRVNSIHPGYIRTALTEEIAQKSGNYSEARAQQDKLQPMGHMGEPLDIAYGILYLASDESKFITASELVIDGGCNGGRLI
ncbi:MAG TPA: glucose 1-dehydrogenase [Legionella sp.]|nr:glucose 1-dehydrogenase [Legionella sp.]